MKENRNMNFRKKILAGLLCLLMILVMYVAASAAQNKSWNNDLWGGNITDIHWTFDPDTQFSLDFSEGKKVLWVIPVPTLRMNVTIRFGVAGIFDLDLKQANLPAGTTIDSEIESMNGLYRCRLTDSFNEDEPGSVALGFNMEGYLTAGATQPVQVKGRFADISTVRISLNGISYDYEPAFEFTSVKPRTAGETIVYVGATLEEKMKVGEIRWRSYKIGPILTGNIGSTAGARTSAVLKKDEWTDQNIRNDNPDSIHTCTEEGRPGCVDGTVLQVKDIFSDLKAGLTLPVIDYTVFQKTWPVIHNSATYNRRHYVQSLTWNEKLKYQEHCSHYVYKVPVAVWMNKSKTIPAPGVYVQKEGYTNVDSNVSQFASRKTGEDGKTILYLPYVDGRHTIIAEPYNSDPQYRKTKGSAQQPSDMKRGANDQVDIILESSEKVRYTVRKDWDIDFELKDKPEQIEVLLQAQYYNTGYFCWQGVQKATLNEDNNWVHTFEEVPRYEMNNKGEMVEIKYRIRELKEKSNDGGGANPEDVVDIAQGLADGEIADVNVVQEGEGLFHPDNGEYAEDSKRVVPSRWDLDNIFVWSALKKKLTTWEELWQCEPTMNYVKTLAKASIFPSPSVTYKVGEYDTIVGEHVDEHKTKYYVEYKTSDDGLTTTIKNTAMMDMSMYKRWIMLGDAKEPDYVYLALCYRLKEEYREYAGQAAEKYAGLWIPVIKPLGGDKINVINLIGGAVGGTGGEVLETISKLDLLNLLSVPIAVGKAKKPTDDGNLLTAWRVKFQVKKYGWLGIDGLPVEFQAMELSSAVVTDVVKFLTGFDIPISLSFNLSGDLYLSVAGKLYQIPYLDQDWERTANVINTWMSVDGEASTAIGGTKYWVNDKEEDRPEYLKIHVWEEKKEGTGENAVTERTSVGTVTINKKDNEGKNSWVWALTDKQVSPNVTLDSSKTYIVTEEYPENYQHKDKYVCTVNGHDLTNTWTDQVRVQILKKYDTRLVNTTNYFPEKLTFRITDENGSSVGRPEGYAIYPAYGHTGYGYTPNTGPITLVDASNPPGSGETDTYAVDGLNGKNISRFKITEEITYNADRPVYFYPEVTGPVLSMEKDSNGNSTGTYTFTVTNRVQRPVGIRVRKKWTGDEDLKTKRPDSITVDLKRDGTTIRTVTLRAPDGESRDEWVSEVIEKDSNDQTLMCINPETGKPYQYTVQEKDVPSSYNSSYSVKTTEGDGGKVRRDYEFTITNELTEKETVTVKGKKTWDDNDSGNTRPDSIVIRLMTGDGPATDESGNYIEQTVSESDNWSWEFKHLPRHDGDGEEIRYRVVERAAGASAGSDASSGEASGTDAAQIQGYTASYSDPVYDVETKTWTCDITNSSDRINITAVKVWEDNDNEIGIRPEEVTIRLVAKTGESSTEKETVKLNEGNSWHHTFKLLPKKEGDQDITYSVEEDPVDGYETKITSAEEGGSFTITNTISEKYINIPVTKIWQGDDEKKSDRPDSVTVRLYRGDEEIDSMPVLASNGWKGMFRGVPKKDENGQDISYSLKEDKVSGYQEAQISGSAEEGFTVTNEYSGKIDITVRKVWETYDGKEVEYDNILFTLRRKVNDGENENVYTEPQFLRKDEGWTKTYTDLPKYDESGNKYTYSVMENSGMQGFVTTITETASSAGPVFIITNKQEKRDITVTKVWDDDDDAQGRRPENITVYLLADGEKAWKKASDQEAVEHSSVIPAGTSPNSAVFNNCPVFREDGKTYVQYTVDEVSVDGYATSVTGNMEDGFTITNTLKREKKNITVRKKWKDDNNKYKNRPDSVTIRLYADGVEKTSASVTASDPDSNVWSYTFTDLPVMDQSTSSSDMDQSGSSSRVIQYTVKEDPVPGYDSEMSGNAVEGFTFTNTPQKTSVAVKKVWNDNDNANGKRPDSVNVYLYRNDQVYKLSKKLEESNGWKYTWTDLPAYQDGVENEWRVEEDRVEGYTGEITGSASEGFTITNTPARVQTTNVTVTKEWIKDPETGEPAEESEHPPVTVILMSDKKVEGEPEEVDRYTITAEDGWTHTFTDLPVYARSRRVIVYSVEEEPLEGYGDPYYTNGQYSFVIQNWKADKVGVIVEKIWSGDEEAQRPESVTVHLKKNGSICATDTLTKEKDWKTGFEKLDRFDENGQTITYTVEEEDVDGYKGTVESSVDDSGTLYQFTITNTRTKPGGYRVTYSVSGDVPEGYTAPAEKSGLPEGTSVTVEPVPESRTGTKDGKKGTFTFTGWTAPEGVDVQDNTFMMPAKDVEFKGVWKFTEEQKKYKVTYIILGDKPSQSSPMPENLEDIAHGTTMTMPADLTTSDTSKGSEPGTWEFSGWVITKPDGLTATNGEYTMPEADVTISGSWSFTPDKTDEYTLTDPVLPGPKEPANPETVTITWLNYDGTMIEKTKVPYGTTPEHTAPERAPSAQGKTYSFKGWSPAIKAATEDAAYTAQFLEQDVEGGTESEVPVPNPVVPEDPDTVPTNHEDLPEITTKKHYYEVYQIFRGDYTAMPVDPEDPSKGTMDILTNIVWGENGTIPAETGQTVQVGEPVDQAVIDALVAVADEELDRTKLDVIEKYVRLDSNPYRTITLKPGDLENSIQLPPGYYLIRDAEVSQTGRHDAYTTYITVVIKDYTIQPKSVIPTVDKQVYDDYDGANSEGWAETADHTINESFRFALIGTIPYNRHLVDYRENGYIVKFTDTMSPGVTFEGIDKVLVNGNIIEPAQYTLSGVSAGDAGKTWTIQMNVKDIIGEQSFGSEDISVIVLYNAHLNENAIAHTASDDGENADNTNKNSVFMEYSNNPNTSFEDDMGKTQQDNVWVFTYEVKNVKRAETEDGRPLAGAAFILLGEDGIPVKMTKSGTTFIVADQNTQGDVVTEMYTDETGEFRIKGLDAGTYTLRETIVPPGYNSLDDTTFTFTATHEESPTEGSAELNLIGDGMTNIIVNRSGSALPSTGGSGTALYYIAGTILALAAGAALGRRRRTGTR